MGARGEREQPKETQSAATGAMAESGMVNSTKAKVKAVASAEAAAALRRAAVMIFTPSVRAVREGLSCENPDSLAWGRTVNTVIA